MLSFLSFLVYLFLIFIRPQDWMPVVKGARFVSIIAIVTVFFLLVERFSRKKPDFVRVPQNAFMGLLFVAVLMSHIANTYFYGLIMAFKSFMILMILYFLMVNSINTVGKTRAAIWFIVFLVALLVVQGIHQAQTGYGWAGQPLTRGYTPDDIRINWIGIFYDPNDLALIFVIAAGILVAFLFCPASFLSKLLAFPLLGMMFYGIYLTNSRGGVLALVTTVFFFFIRRTRRFLVGGIIGGLAAMGIFAFGPSRLSTLSTSEASAYTRIELWYQGIVMLRTHPLFGVGYDMFMNDLPQTAHNSYILAGAELGFFGLFCWMGLIYASLKQLTVIENAGGPLATYAYGLQAGLVGFCTAAFFLSRTYVVVPYMLFALSGAMYHAAGKLNPEIRFSFRKRDYTLITLMSIGIIVFAYIVLKMGL